MIIEIVSIQSIKSQWFSAKNFKKEGKYINTITPDKIETLELLELN